MTTQGFGNSRPIEVVQLRGMNQDEFGRAADSYRRQGLSRQKTLEMVAVSSHYFIAAEAGFIPGEDIRYDPAQNNGEGGLFMTERMAEYVRSWEPQKWDYFMAEGVVQKLEAKQEGGLTREEFVALCLETLRDPSRTVDGGAKTREALGEMLTIAGLTEADASIRLDEWIAGDDSLLGEVGEICRRMQLNLAKEEDSNG